MDVQNIVQNVSRWIHEFRWDPATLPMATWEYPVGGAIAYIALIKFIQSTTGSEIRSKSLEVVHNLFLVLLSLSMLICVVYGAFLRYSTEGFVGGILCSQRTEQDLWNGPIGAATYIFYLSKYYEFIDTVFLALRQKPVILLHQWHHCVMPFLCWSWFSFPWFDGAWWCCFVNSFIHTIMYSYYLASTLGIRVWFKKYITSLQIIQFMTGLVYSAAYLWQEHTHGCAGNPMGCYISNLVNISFLVMFYQFFKKSYEKKSDKKSE
eukprot:m.559588 g.559588  ORF g.559588 m.559588 type:complete len:264 (+) comp22206_c0_seq2:119-910(+)